MRFKRSANPDSAVSLADLKEELRIVDDVENRMLLRIINASYRTIEQNINQDILAATYVGQETLTAGQQVFVELPTNFSDIVVENGTFFVVDNTLAVTATTDGLVEVSYNNGLFAFADELDPDLHQAISLLAVHMYENRDQPVTGVPTTVEYLIQPYKVY